MTRIVTPEEAQRLLDTPTSIPGSSDWDYVYINTYLANFLDEGPSLARTVVQQAEQIKRLQHAVRFLESVWGSDIITELREKDILADKDMEP